MKRKFMKTMAIVPVVCTLLTINSMTVGAVKNDWDSEWKGGSGYYCDIRSYCDSKKDSGGRNNGCCIRKKGDTSSIYVYNKSSTTAKVTVWGEPDLVNIHCFDPTWCSGYATISTNKWSVPGEQKRFIPQYIGERTDLEYAHVHFTTSGTNGLWSADSSGSYPNADKN